MVRSLVRWLRHLCSGSLALRRRFPPHALQAIEHTIRECERRQPGEIRFAVDAALSLRELWRGLTPREAAIEAFSRLRVWDTADNNGVLIYLLLADCDVEIIADRGVGASAAEWETCCRQMEQHFSRGHFRDGAVAGIEAVAAVLARHPPDRPDAGNEQPDDPAVF